MSQEADEKCRSAKAETYWRDFYVDFAKYKTTPSHLPHPALGLVSDGFYFVFFDAARCLHLDFITVFFGNQSTRYR